jgi:polar amino acid transport system substrate-binding protein
MLIGMICWTVSAGLGHAEGTVEKLKSNGFVRVGFANDAPWSFAKSDGDLAGVDYELAQLVFDRLGIKELQGVLNKFGSLVPGLQANRFDILASGFYIRPARCEQVLFSVPTVAIGDGVIVSKGNPKAISSYQSIMRDPGIKLGAVVGAATMKNAIAAGVPETQITTFPDNISVVAAIKSGRVDAAIMTAAAAQTIVNESRDGSIQRALPFEQAVINGKQAVNYAAFAFRKDQADFVEAFNTELSQLVGTEAHIKILEKYGLSKDEIPSKDVTTDQLCKP